MGERFRASRVAPVLPLAESARASPRRISSVGALPTLHLMETESALRDMAYFIECQFRLFSFGNFPSKRCPEIRFPVAILEQNPIETGERLAGSQKVAHDEVGVRARPSW
jgi:hypothetical protein